MLSPRVIPVLLVQGKGLVKTIGFEDPKYVGDPLNAVRIFNEKEVDEIAVLDIDASVERREPDYRMIESLAVECRMPLCYGGGVRTVEQAQRVFALGVEKVALSSAAIESPLLVSQIAERVGCQSVVVVLDVRRRSDGSGYEVFTHRGKRPAGLEAEAFARVLEGLGVGEIVVNSIDRDGRRDGYDLDLAGRMRAALSIPLTILGGAGTLKDIGDLIAKAGLVGAAAGSLFVFKGVYRAVLINYPRPADKEALVRDAWHRHQRASG